MKTGHMHIVGVLSKFWEEHAIEMNPFETLALVEWTHRYYRELRQFGVHDDSVELGYIQLCSTYAKKTHNSIMPMIISILKQERYDPKRSDQLDEDPRSGYLITNSPTDLLKLFEQTFELVLAKKIKSLILKTLKLFSTLTTTYQRALVKVLDLDLAKLPHDYLIAQCNNCFTFFEAVEDTLLQPLMKEMNMITEEEVEANYSQRNIMQFF